MCEDVDSAKLLLLSMKSGESLIGKMTASQALKAIEILEGRNAALKKRLFDYEAGEALVWAFKGQGEGI